MDEKKVIYLDNNATTMVDPEAVKAMMPYFSELYGNASSMHDFGNNLNKAIHEARQNLADLLGAENESELIITSCGSESDNTAIYSALRTYPERRHFITSQVEHPAIINTAKVLESRGYRVTYLPVDRAGRLNLDDLKAALTDDTFLVSLMWANNETGTVFPVEEAAKICAERGVLFHTDAVQAVGKVPMSLKDSAISMLSLSGHKLHAPKGIGALYVKRGVRFKPFITGGHQERGRRAGTENVPSLIALGVAAKRAKEFLPLEEAQVGRLRDKLEQSILHNIDNTLVNGDIENRLSGTTNISFGYVEGEAILLMLNQYGICASSGSACSSGSLEPSSVLRAMGVPFTHAHGSIRFSLSRFTTEEEIDKVIEVMPQIIGRLREISPYTPAAK